MRVGENTEKGHNRNGIAAIVHQLHLARGSEVLGLDKALCIRACDCCVKQPRTVINSKNQNRTAVQCHNRYFGPGAVFPFQQHLHTLFVFLNKNFRITQHQKCFMCENSTLNTSVPLPFIDIFARV